MRVLSAPGGSWIAAQKSFGLTAEHYATNLKTGERVNCTDANHAMTTARQKFEAEQVQSIQQLDTHKNQY